MDDREKKTKFILVIKMSIFNQVPWLSWLKRLSSKQENASSNFPGIYFEIYNCLFFCFLPDDLPESISEDRLQVKC